MILTLFLLIFSFSSFAFVPPQSFDSIYINLEEKILQNQSGKYEGEIISYLSDAKANLILRDYENKVNTNFKVPDYFYKSTRFWFSIYTQFDSRQVVIHDTDNLALVYHILDFGPLHKSNIHRFAKSKLQTQLALEYTNKLKKTLTKLGSSDFKRLSLEETQILNTISKARLVVPKNQKKKKSFFLNLARNIRTQTGQRDKVYHGVLRSIPFLPFLHHQLDNFVLPREVLAIAFLESSFNTTAESKVAASGIWQFMPFISDHFMPNISANLDYRSNPVISSLAAFHLIKENKKILGRWDLAIPAYNSGTKHLLRAKRKYKNKDDFSLKYILDNYEHDHIGFASKNFYTEFLALVHVLAYKDRIYPLDGFAPKKKALKHPNKLSVFITKCFINPKRFFKLLKSSGEYTKKLNAHFKNFDKKFPKGTIIVSDLNLTNRKYLRLSDDQLRFKYPKNYWRYGTKLKCNY